MSRDQAAVLAIDGGNSKTDIALVAADGTLLAAGRGSRGAHVPHPGGAGRDRRGDRGGRTGGGTSARVAGGGVHRSLHGQRRPPRGRGTAGRDDHGGRVEHHHRGGQRHVRRAPGGPGHSSRPPLGGGRDLRRRDQLPGRRPGRADHRVPRAGRHHRRLGRRLRPGPGRAVVGDPRRGRPGPADRAARGGGRPLRQDRGPRRRGGDPPGQDRRGRPAGPGPAAAGRRGRRAIRWPTTWSAGWPTRSSRWRPR